MKVRWADHFIANNRIVLLAQSGKHLLSTVHKSHISQRVEFHLVRLKPGFDSRLLNGYRIENADETQVFNMDNGKTFGFRGEVSVKN